MAAVHVVTAAVVQDGLDGLITVRIISKARPCAKLTGMIEAALAPISHVSGSHQLGRVLHEVINICILGERLRESCTLCRESEVCWREPCVELLKSVSSIDRGATFNRSTRVEAFVEHGKRRRAGPGQSKNANPCTSELVHNITAV